MIFKANLSISSSNPDLVMCLSNALTTVSSTGSISLSLSSVSASLALTVADSAMVIFVSTGHVNVRRELELKCDSSGPLNPQYFGYGALNESQTAALLFHLFKWKDSPPNLDESRIRENLARQGFDLKAHYVSHGCLYDY